MRDALWSLGVLPKKSWLNTWFENESRNPHVRELELLIGGPKSGPILVELENESKIAHVPVLELLIGGPESGPILVELKMSQELGMFGS